MRKTLDLIDSPSNPITPEIAELIRKAVGPEAVIIDADRLEPFGRDATDLAIAPELVVEPVCVEQIQALLRLANQLRFSVTPRGLGTGLAGGAVAVHGGVVLSMAKMNRILSIDPDNLIAVVEPGVLNLDLKNAAEARGLFYPPDPASLDTCSIGGNAATNAGGPRCVKYGTTRDYVLGLDAVLPTGELIRAGVETRKGVVGYDLVHLLVGSEGTLGVITRLILKLIPRPPALTTLVALFPDLPSAMRAVSLMLQRGHIPSAVEFLDHNCLSLVGDLLPFEGVLNAGAFLLVEIDGAPEALEKEVEGIGEICMETESMDVLLAPDAYRRSKMWDVRREVSLRIEHGSTLYSSHDIVVPLARISEFVLGLPALERQYGLKIYSFGHAGDGNIHLNISGNSLDLRERAEELTGVILERVIAMGGTISGEHGIGYTKKRYLPLELSSESIRLQKGIKRLFDPNMILNPGKLFDGDL